MVNGSFQIVTGEARSLQHLTHCYAVTWVTEMLLFLSLAAIALCPGLQAGFGSILFSARRLATTRRMSLKLT